MNFADNYGFVTAFGHVSYRDVYRRISLKKLMEQADAEDQRRWAIARWLWPVNRLDKALELAGKVAGEIAYERWAANYGHNE